MKTAPAAGVPPLMALLFILLCGLDPPQAYLALAASRPRVDVRSFGDALGELQQLLRA